MEQTSRNNVWFVGTYFQQIERWIAVTWISSSQTDLLRTAGG